MLVLLTVFIHLLSYQVNAYGNGWCHSFWGLDIPEVDYIYPSGELAWSKLEPEEGKYNFTIIDNMVSQVRAARKKLHIQLMVTNPQIQSDGFQAIPQWAINKGMHVYYVTDSEGKKWPIMPIQWDPIYLDLHEKFWKAFAARYEKPEYYDVIEAVVMQSGGYYGESVLPAVKGVDAGDEADALDPNNIFVKELARVFLGSEDRSPEIARRFVDGNHWEFDDYYIKAVQKIIDVYGSSLSHYPFALQLGFGMTGQGRVMDESIEYGLSKYGSHMWLRLAWWGSFSGEGTDDPNVTDHWARYQDRTVLVYEMGHPAWWCAAEGGNTKGGCYECCQWDTRKQTHKHNTYNINMAINSGVVATCLQGMYFTEPNKYQINIPELKSRLISNVNKKINLLKISPIPTSHQVYNTPTPSTIIKTDINNDGKTTMLDYYYVVFAKTGAIIHSSMNADLNKDNQINNLDISLVKKEIKK